MNAERPDMGDNAKRAAQRAAYHFLRAAIEVVAGVDAFLDELTKGANSDDDDGDGSSGREQIDVE